MIAVRYKQEKLSKLIEANLDVDSLEGQSYSAIITKIPLEKHIGKYFFKAELNNQETSLMIDWGAGMTLGLTPYTALKAKAKLSEKSLSASTIDTLVNLVQGKIDSLQISAHKTNVTLEDVPLVLGSDDISVLALNCITIFRGEGMVGMRFLAGFKKFAIDMEKDELWLGKLPENMKTDPNCITIPCYIRNGNLLINAIIEGISCEMIVDIGGFIPIAFIK